MNFLYHKSFQIKKPPSRVLIEVALMAAEQRPEYF